MPADFPEPSVSYDQELLLALMHSIPDRIYFKDRQSRFIRINRAMADSFKLADPDEAIGQTDFDFYSAEHAKEAFEDEQRILKLGEPIVGKMEKETHSDGSVRWASTTKMPLRDRQGRIIGTFGISRDETAKHEAEEKISNYAAELTQKNAQMEKDLVMAREVQLAFLPQHYPVFPRGVVPAESTIRCCHRYYPTAEVGGDFFHVSALSDTLAEVLICDVMGHGVPAALITAAQGALVQELAPLAGDPGAFLTELNRRLLTVIKRLQAPMFVSAFHLVVDVAVGVVSFANAGHPTPLHVQRRKGQVRPLTAEDGETGAALGVFPDAVYRTHQTRLETGDSLLLFTDGLCDIEGCHGEQYYDDKRLISAVRKHSHCRGEELLDALLGEIRQFAGDAPFMDDVCMVGVDVARLMGDVVRR